MADDQIKQALRAGLAFLEREGFVLVKLTWISTDLTGDQYSVIYRSEKARRDVGVAYFPERGSAVASIKDIDRPFDWSDAGAMYLKVPDFEHVPGDGVGKLSAYLSGLEETLLSNFVHVLRGAPMENDAFDWSPYK